MRPPRTRREKEIWEASDALLTEHGEIKKVTGERIMGKLLDLGYKKGCLNEIYKYRRSWWEVRGITEDEAKGMTRKATPSSFTDPISRAVSIVQDELKTEASREIKELEEKYQGQLTTTQEQYTKASQQLELLQEEHQQLTATAQYLRTENLDMKQQLNAQQNVLDVVSAKNELLDKVYQQYRTDSSKKYEELKIEYQNNIERLEQRNIELARQHRIDLDQVKTSLENNRQQFLADKDQLQQSNHQLSEQLSQLKLTKERLSTEKSQLNDLLMSQKQKFEEQIQDLRMQQQHAQQEAKIYQQSLLNNQDHYEKVLAKLEQFNQQLTDKLLNQQQQLNTLLDSKSSPEAEQQES